MLIGHKIFGRGPVERLGFLLALGGVLVIAITAVNRGDDAIRVIDAAVTSLFDSGWMQRRYAWPARVAAFGLFLRLLALPIYRWLFAGSR